MGRRPYIHNCTLVNPRPGKAVGFYRDGKKVETLKGERFVMKTEASATVVPGPEGKGHPMEKRAGFPGRPPIPARRMGCTMAEIRAL
jgi:hypothetical protein